MDFLMIKELIHIFEGFSTLMKEAGVLVARYFVLEDVRIVGGSQLILYLLLLLLFLPFNDANTWWRALLIIQFILL